MELENADWGELLSQAASAQPGVIESNAIAWCEQLAAEAMGTADAAKLSFSFEGTGLDDFRVQVDGPEDLREKFKKALREQQEKP